eukprot:jgi/Chrpa1/3228/Chrysochromulina_OHIO_Genome00013809-RA
MQPMSTDATDVDHCVVAFNADDGFEFFGGTVNVKYLSALFVGDYSFAAAEPATAQHAAIASSLALSTTVANPVATPSPSPTPLQPVAVAIPTAFSIAITTTTTAAFTASAIASAIDASTVTFTTISTAHTPGPCPVTSNSRVCVVTLMHNATNWHSMLILINSLYDLLLLQATVLLRCGAATLAAATLAATALAAAIAAIAAIAAAAAVAAAPVAAALAAVAAAERLDGSGLAVCVALLV